MVCVRPGRAAERLVLEVLRSGQLAQGPLVERLEGQVAHLCGTKHAVAVSSGTAALEAALQVLEIGPGDEVLTTPFTFAGTLNAIIASGATARFADIDLDDFNLDPELIEASVSSSTRAVLPVHLYGLPCRIDEVAMIAGRDRIRIVEDAAQALGASVGQRSVGGADVGCFSLYATKNVTAGEGGVITTNDDALADRLRVLRNQGMRARYDHLRPGHNYRLTDLQAAVAIPQLDRIDEINNARRRNAAMLSELLEGVRGLVLPRLFGDRTHVFHQYTVRVTPDAKLDRESLAARLQERGIETGVYYPRLVFDYACYRSHPQVVVSATPMAERAAREVLSLPVHQHLTEAQVRSVGTSVRSCLA